MKRIQCGKGCTERSDYIARLGYFLRAAPGLALVWSFVDVGDWVFDPLPE